MVNEKILIDFNDPDEKDRWETINDTVMGGISESRAFTTPDNTAIFQGFVSLENSGGFASIRTIPRQFDLKGYAGIMIRVKGDGKNYRLRLRTEDDFDGVAYQATFPTRSQEWIEVRLPFSEYLPVFRGRIVSDAPKLDQSRVRRIGFMIADKQEGTFVLEIAWIRAYAE